MQRRSALLAVLVLLLIGLSGCSAEGSLSMDPAPNATAIANHASIDLADLDTEPSRLVRGAVADSGPTAEGDHPPFRPDRPVAVDGRYYTVTWSAIDSKQVPEFALTLEKSPTNTTGGSIAYEELPAVDRRALPAPDSGLIADDEDIATLAVYNESEQELSVLVSEPRYELVEFGARTVRLTVDGPSPKTISTYRYDASPVANSSEALAGRLEAASLFTLSNLSSGERSIVTKAIGDSHYVDSESDAWTRLVERFAAADPVYALDTNDPEYVDGEYLVRYDGTVYWVDISGYTD
ncbi:hypothetical protein [Halorhabdus sp. CUG00001]|uniref:hypothetical protein n=1 Tax=Halorhabdus sp. CUG00001 TaxID=2600297 RepID=UPI00131E9D36|nr:hypothetical protein [Halorhabdus sp. CUG00001]